MVVRQIEHSSEVSTYSKSHLGLEPLSALINEVDQCDRSITGTGGKVNEAVELRFGRRIKNPVAAETRKPVTLRPSWGLSLGTKQLPLGLPVRTSL